MQYCEYLLSGWYLLKAKPRQERRASENLDNLGFDVFCPTFYTLPKRKGASPAEEVLFPGYLFVSLDSSDVDRFHKIRSTRGVSEVVYFNRITRELYNSGSLPEAQMADVQSLMPRPMPNGDEIIKDIKSIVHILNKKSGQVGKPEEFTPGEKVILDHPLYRDLEVTFLQKLSSMRGEILVQYIKKQRGSDDQVKEEAVAQRKMRVNMEQLHKA